MNTAKISQAAAKIAGCLWSDREQTGTIAQQLRTVEAELSHGTDGDLSVSDRSALIALAATAEQD